MGEKIDAYQIMTDRICSLLERGEIPWRRPWKADMFPRNLKSKKEYRGINVFWLGCSGYSSPYWLTYKQATELGGQVRTGEKASPVVFWKWLNVKDRHSGDDKRIPLLRYFNVFNVAQCDGLDAKVPKHDDTALAFKPIERCEQVVAGYKSAPPISHGGDRACYSPLLDHVRMPPREKFASVEAYYSVLFHELTHSTGHASRLKREGIVDPSMFGSHEYSKEELVAEMGAAFLSGHCSIDAMTVDNSAAYIASWLKKLRNDKSLVVSAAAQAQRAADLILDRTFEERAE